LWPNSWMDEDATWYGSRPRPRQHCARRGPSSSRERGTAAQPPLFGPCLLWPIDWMDQDAMPLGTEVGLGPADDIVRWGSASQKGHTPNFRPVSMLAKRSPISATAELLY